ncbi:MAG TPA: ABC transporter ATP-binding protein [Devosiaceae bacterium]|jgi:NitT/TauT family transport system ATP-binding protein
MAATVEIKDVTQYFETGSQRLTVLQDINLEVQQGEFLVFLGPSGCGKTTVLNMIAGLLIPTEGEVRYDGDVLTGLNKGLGYMTQADSLLPWRTAESNIRLPLELGYHSSLKGDRDRRVREVMEMVGLSGFENHRIAQLSGGMQKRVSLARTLVYDPPVVLMDEPFGALDAILKTVLQSELSRISRQTGKTVIFVTHDVREALILADRVVVFSRRPGRIAGIVDVDLPHPRDAVEVESHPRFGELYGEVWKLLSADESLRRPNATD